MTMKETEFVPSTDTDTCPKCGGVKTLVWGEQQDCVASFTCSKCGATGYGLWEFYGYEVNKQ